MATSAQVWLEKLKKAEKVCFVQNDIKKIHYKFPTGEEMAEEYNMVSGNITRRAWRRKSTMGGQGIWDVELGDPEPQFNNLDVVGIREANTSPYVVKRITRTHLEWRIRNLPYPLSEYSVTADPESTSIIVRTKCKKYYKKIHVPDLQRIGVTPEQKYIQFTHEFNTLIISYQKPPELLNLEKMILEEVKKWKASEDGDIQCKPS